jgi:hypothetical protein
MLNYKYHMQYIILKYKIAGLSSNLLGWAKLKLMLVKLKLEVG